MEDLRKRCFCVLGLWHCYKTAHLILWKNFGPTFLAPAFHRLWPEAKCHKNQKLFSLVWLFNCLSLTYPAIQPKLQKYFNSTKKGTPAFKYFQHLTFFFEFFLPTVRPLPFSYPTFLFLPLTFLFFKYLGQRLWSGPQNQGLGFDREAPSLFKLYLFSL